MLRHVLPASSPSLSLRLPSRPHPALALSPSTRRHAHDEVRRTGREEREEEREERYNYQLLLGHKVPPHPPPPTHPPQAFQEKDWTRALTSYKLALRLGEGDGEEQGPWSALAVCPLPCPPPHPLGRLR